MNSKRILFISVLVLLSLSIVSKEYIVTSPDKKIKVIVTDNEKLEWSIEFNNEVLLKPSKLDIKIQGIKNTLGIKSSVKKVAQELKNSAKEATNSDIKPIVTIPFTPAGNTNFTMEPKLARIHIS